MILSALSNKAGCRVELNFNSVQQAQRSNPTLTKWRVVRL